jgi:type IV fimbrial biogenesis protein FimT
MQTTKPAAIRQRPTLGVSLVECLCAVSIFATSLGLAAPSLSKWRDRQTVLSAAAELETDIQYARSLAVAKSDTIYLTIRTAAEGGTCYVMYTGERDNCECSSEKGAVCLSNAEVVRQAVYPDQGIVKLHHRNATLTFDPHLGTVTPAATFKFRTPAGSVHQIVSIMGRTRSCSPDGVSGLKPCPAS